MCKIKTYWYFIKTAKYTILFSFLFIYAISFFFQYELSFSKVQHNGTSVYRFADLTLPVSFLLVIYAAFNVLCNAETKEILFSLNMKSKLWLLPFSVLFFLLLCAPLFAWYALSFNFWYFEVLVLSTWAYFYGSLFCLLLFIFRQPLLAFLSVFALHMLNFMVLPFNRMDGMRLSATDLNMKTMALYFLLSTVVLFFAELKEKRYFE